MENKKGFSDTDALEWLRTGIILILGYIIIKALLSAETPIRCVCNCIKNGVIYLN